MAAQKKKSPKRKRSAMWTPVPSKLSPVLFVLTTLLALALVIGSSLLRNPQAEEAESSRGGLVLNELMCDNGATPPGGATEAPDWVELRNSGSEPAALKGCSLVLDARYNRLYSLPDVTLAPGECALVYCVGQAQVAGYGEWGAPFRLNASGGETLTLLSGSDVQLDSVALPELSMNEVYARNVEGNWEVRESATPGVDNESSVEVQLSQQSALSGDVEFTEAVSDNTLYFPDEAGGYYDYIELHNSGTESVNLENWSLSDNAGKPGRWRFPAVVLPADGYLTVHCSGLNRRENVQHLHTNFKLSASESIYLFQPRGELIGEVALPELVADQAWSLVDGVWSTELGPTPGRENSRAAAASCQQERFGAALNGVYLSEIVAAPKEQDSDWLELGNASAQTVNLSGWGLSDDTARPRRWQFPTGVTLAPGQYLVVALTGDPDVTYKNIVCADFALSSRGGYTVCLSDPEGQVQDAVYLGTQYGGVCYARYPDADGFRYGDKITFQAVNAGGNYLDRAPMATASVSGGLYSGGQSFSVELSAPEGSRIYYTLDSSDPDESDTLYTGPIPISSTTILRSRVYRDGSMPSFIDTQSYLYDIRNESRVYIVSLVTDERNLTGEGYGMVTEENLMRSIEREAHVEIFLPDGERVISQGCGIALHGQGSRMKRIKSFNVIARSEYGPNRFEYPLFSQRDYTSYQSILLRPSGEDQDMSFMRDSVLTGLMRGSSLMFQETEICVVYINGKYYTLCYLRERINKHSICQFEGWEGMEDQIDIVVGNDTVKHGSNASFEKLLKWVRSNDMSSDAAFAYLDERIDMQNYMEYMAAEIFVGNEDLLNVRRYRNAKADGKWHWALYDLDWGFYNDVNSISRWLRSGGTGASHATDNTLFIACMKNPTFRDRFLTFMGEQLAGRFSPQNVVAAFNQRYERIAPMLDQYRETWGFRLNGVSMVMDYAETRQAKLIGYFRETFKFSDADMQKYFGAAIEKIQEFERGKS